MNAGSPLAVMRTVQSSRCTLRWWAPHSEHQVRDAGGASARCTWWSVASRHNGVVGVIDSILENPSAWTGERVLDELPVRMYDDDRLADRSVPGWLRAVIVLLDFDTHVQMEGLLGWWENRGSDDLDDVIAAFRAVGLADQASLLVRVREVLDPRALDADQRQTLYDVSSFVDRHGEVTEEQYRAFDQFEEELYLNADDGPDLYTALVAHADSGLAGTC